MPWGSGCGVPASTWGTLSARRRDSHGTGRDTASRTGGQLSGPTEEAGQGGDALIAPVPRGSRAVPTAAQHLGPKWGNFPLFHACIALRDLRPALASAWGFSSEEMAPEPSRLQGLWGVPGTVLCCGTLGQCSHARGQLQGEVGTIPVPTNPCPAGTVSPGPSPPSPNLSRPSPATLAVVPHLWLSAAPREQRGGSALWAPG